MIFDYLPLIAGTGAMTRRPVVDVSLSGIDESGITCLADTGAVHNRFDSRLAELAGIDLTCSDLESTDFIVGGGRYRGTFVNVQLGIGEYHWDAPVCFVENWNHDFQLLGQEGFFAHFDVLFSASHYQLTVEPCQQWQVHRVASGSSKRSIDAPRLEASAGSQAILPMHGSQ